jgi:hypothetical protein
MIRYEIIFIYKSKLWEILNFEKKNVYTVCMARNIVFYVTKKFSSVQIIYFSLISLKLLQ